MKTTEENKQRKRKLFDEETREEKMREIERGEKDKDIYSPESLELMEEADEITELDEGVMEGYEKGDFLAECAKCKKMLTTDFIEKEIDEEVYRFCSSKCADKFKKPQGSL